MANIVDRTEELATLEEQYASTTAAMVVIYGRRRVGKTALITEFLKTHPGLYFLTTEETEEQNLNAFRAQAARFLNDSLLEQAVINSWDVVFDRLTQACKQPSDKRLVIAIDEFQYLGKANPAFPSVFQRIWDTLLSKHNVMVILCGSLISLMESQTLSYSSPLYGRRTAQIRMKQVPFRYYQDFFIKENAAPDVAKDASSSAALSMRRLIELYSVTGGVPKYIESFKLHQNIYSSIARNVLNPNSYLYDEPNFLLSKEVSEVGTYFSIIKAIAAGSRRSGEIAASMNVKQTSLSKYLKTLEQLDILHRDVPVTEKNPEKSKRGLYRIKDNYLRFWFLFVFPNMGLLETGHVDDVLKLVKQNFIDRHVAYVYEDICRQRVWDFAASGRLLFVPSRVGAWWGAKDVEIDVCAVNDQTGQVAFGECKFWKRLVGVNVLRHLEEQAQKAMNDAAFRSYNASPTYMLFSIEGFTDELRAVADLRDDVTLVQ